MKGLQYLESQLADYQLIDCGGGEKLERFGAHVVRRPEPQAIWRPSLSEDEWARLADATFRRDAHSDERGQWERRPGMPERWTMDYRPGAAGGSGGSAGVAAGAGGAPGGSGGSGSGSGGSAGAPNLRLRLALTGFKHVGVFPEQAENWRYIYNKVREFSRAREEAAGERTSAGVNEQNRGRNAASGAKSGAPKILNLFAYTGGATLAARAAGAMVTHVDSVKQTVSWARDNLILSELADGGAGDGSANGAGGGGAARAAGAGESGAVADGGAGDGEGANGGGVRAADANGSGEGANRGGRGAGGGEGANRGGEGGGGATRAAGANGEGTGGGGVRWMVDDALKFVRREVRRGSRYDGIILDPPAYGRGPDGEKWVLEQGLDEMLALCSQLLDSQGFMVLNLYSMGISALVARTLVRTHFGAPKPNSQPLAQGDLSSPARPRADEGAVVDEQFGELFVTDRSGKNLPLGVYYRFSRG